MTSPSLRQLLYVSVATSAHDTASLIEIMATSQRNNRLDGITGLLWSDGVRFAQVLEGRPAALAEVMDRIAQDHRHKNISIVHDTEIAGREFGDWSMTMPAENPLAQGYQQRMRGTLATLTGSVAGLLDQVIGSSRQPAT